MCSVAPICLRLLFYSCCYLFVSVLDKEIRDSPFSSAKLQVFLHEIFFVIFDHPSRRVHPTFVIARAFVKIKLDNASVISARTARGLIKGGKICNAEGLLWQTSFGRKRFVRSF